jgi:hypothetical protein
MGMQELQVGTAVAKPGERAFGFLEVGETNDGAPIRIPVGILNGSGDGPVLWLQNGAHGMEYVGMGAIQRILHGTDPASLAGAVVCVPMVNILALRAGTRGAPQDGLDLNRTYPGRPIESAMHVFAHTEIVVHKFFSELKRVANYLVDCHAGGWFTTMSPYAQYFTSGDSVEIASEEMARASGMTLIWHTSAREAEEKAPNSLKIWSYKAGIPGITLELGGQGRLDEGDVAGTHRALQNIMMKLGLLEGEPTIPGPQYFVKKGHWLRPETGGILHCRAKPLDRVKEGQIIHTITDVLGREREHLSAPVDGVIVGIRTLAVVNSGEYCGNVGEIEGEVK